MATITMPEFGLQGLGTIKNPNFHKDQVRADFREGEFERMIEVKGYRLAWQRASVCPCVGVNTQTQQVDPNCPLCKGKGWVYFGPPGYLLDEAKVGALTDVQKIALADGAVIMGLMTGLSTNLKALTEVGHWMTGTSLLTVRWENRLGYYDRITGLDSMLVYSENIIAGQPKDLLGTRYPIVSVNYLRSVATVFKDYDFTVQKGKIAWVGGHAPKAGTKLAIHYQTFPVWLVIEHPHTVRSTMLKFKQKTPTTPIGSPNPLPLQAIIRYDFLPL